MDTESIQHLIGGGLAMTVTAVIGRILGISVE